MDNFDKEKILLVEDNEAIILGLDYLFAQENISYEVVRTKKDAINFLKEKSYDLVILDIGLPDGNGYDICEFIKKTYTIPVIFLTAKDEEDNIVQGLDMGADDYIIKPFRNKELISRIKNILKRNKKENDIIKIRNVVINQTNGKVFVNNEEVILTKLEYKILVNLFNNKNRLVTRDEILNDIWDTAGNFVNDNTLTVYIKRIREKINDKDGKIIETVRGMGYRIGDK